MDFELPGEDHPKRKPIRDWFEAHPKPSARQLAEAGFVVPHWPKPWGLAADSELQLIIDQEMKRAGVFPPRNPVAVNNCAQSLLTHGTEAHRQRFLWPALAGEEIWCMLFSEPSGGSDLSALRTVARREGDHYVVKGHKIWTSLAHKAKVGVLVARTQPDLPKHKGLSQFLVDMDTPGIRIRPIIDMSGHDNEYNEVFLEDVRIPADRLLGKEGEGWALSTTQLQTERVALSKPGAIWGHGPSARELVEGLAEIGALEDGALRDEAANVYIEGEILRLLAYRALSDRMNARTPGPEGAIHKMLAAPHGQRVVDLAKRAQGPRGMIAGEKPFPSQLASDEDPYGDWDYAFWFSPAVTLGVGTQEILKNVVAERMLGLPRDVDPTASQPWSDKAQGGLKELMMDFSLSEDHLMLRQSARTFLEKEISLARVQVPGATVADAGYKANWSKIVAMGWQGLVIDEAHDGLGLSCIDLAIILGEIGRTLAPSPFLGTLFGTWAVQKGGSEDQKRRILPTVAAGTAQLAVAVAESSGAVDGPCREATARRDGGAYRLTGVKSFVIDGLSADWLLVAAQDGAAGQRAFFLVEAAQDGVQAELLPWRDVTREVCDVRLKDAVGEKLPVDDGVVWPWLRDRILFALATESAAGTQRVLEMTTDYAKERVAFGKPIGTYQAIKHSLAEMAGQAECANVATLYAAWALAEENPRASLAAAMAKAFASDAYVSAAHRSIQIFGAIGFTWEMTNHLYYKRARANAELFGSPRAQRARVIEMVEKKAA